MDTASYPKALATLQAAMAPVFAYCQRTHAAANAGNPAHHGRLHHALQLEQLLNATAAYAATLHNPPAPSLATRIRNLPAFQNRAALTPEHRAAAGTVTSYDL